MNFNVGDIVMLTSPCVGDGIPPEEFGELHKVIKVTSYGYEIDSHTADHTAWGVYPDMLSPAGGPW